MAKWQTHLLKEENTFIYTSSFATLPLCQCSIFRFFDSFIFIFCEKNSSKREETAIRRFRFVASMHNNEPSLVHRTPRPHSWYTFISSFARQLSCSILVHVPMGHAPLSPFVDSGQLPPSEKFSDGTAPLPPPPPPHPHRVGISASFTPTNAVCPRYKHEQGTPEKHEKGKIFVRFW